MNNVLVISSSANGESSVSGQLAARFVDQLRGRHPGLGVIVRDVGAEPVPHLTADTVAAIKGTPASEAELTARALSDALIAELQAADLVVIASPMYNFGMSSTLKAWFDHVLRAGVTFRYTESGPEGLLKGKKAVLIQSRGGLYSEGPAAGMNSQEGHIRTMLGFAGIDDVTVVLAEKLAFGPEAAAASIEEATTRLNGFAHDHLALAA